MLTNLIYNIFTGQLMHAAETDQRMSMSFFITVSLSPKDKTSISAHLEACVFISIKLEIGKRRNS